MPTFYEGPPIAEFSFSISQEEFIKAYYQFNNNKSFFSRKEVRGGIFISLILLTLCTIPHFIKKFGTFFFSSIFIFLFVFLFYFSVFVQPAEIKKDAKKIYETNGFLKLENTVVLYRDTLIYKNQYEEFSQYLTDFSFCMESSEYFIFKGGERDLLIVKKENLDEKTIALISENLYSFFTSNYIKIKDN